MLTALSPLNQKGLNLSNLLSVYQGSSKREFEEIFVVSLKEQIVDQKSLLKVSIWLGSTPSTLRKILSGCPLSKFLFKKLSQDLQNWRNPDEALLQSPKVQRLLLIYRLYQVKGTLENVGKQVGLRRERIRQLLNNGERLGLFEYKKPELSLPSIPKEKLIEDYKNLLQLGLVAKNNKISLHQLKQLVKYFQITGKELEATRLKGHKLKSILLYYTYVKSFGRHPSTAELQKTSEGRYLSWKITKLWGLFHTFRNELKIQFPAKKFIPI
jgi:hypothetical protein